MEREEIKNEIKGYCSSVQKVMEVSLDVRNRLAKIMQYHKENPQAYEKLMEEEDFIKMNNYLVDREVFIFGILETIKKYDTFIQSSIQENDIE